MPTPTETSELPVRHSGLDDLLGPPLLPTDTCDKCGPGTVAKIAVRFTSGGMLTLCSHCFNRHSMTMHNMGIVLSVTASRQ